MSVRKKTRRSNVQRPRRQSRVDLVEPPAERKKEEKIEQKPEPITVQLPSIEELFPDVKEEKKEEEEVSEYSQSKEPEPEEAQKDDELVLEVSPKEMSPSPPKPRSPSTPKPQEIDLPKPTSPDVPSPELESEMDDDLRLDKPVEETEPAEAEPKKREPPPNIAHLRWKAHQQPVIKRKLRKITKPQVIPKEMRKEEDPLDYLAKWCIIHPARLPYYERVYQQALVKQVNKYEGVPSAMEMENILQSRIESESGYGSIGSLEEEQARLDKIQNALLIDRQAIQDDSPGESVEDIASKKLAFILNHVTDRHLKYKMKYEELLQERVKLLAGMCRFEFPEFIEFKEKKSKKQKAKNKSTSTDDDKQKQAAPAAPTTPKEVRPSPRKVPPHLRGIIDPRPDLTDDEVVAKITKKTYDYLARDERVKRINAMIARSREKVEDLENRISQIENELVLMKIRSREAFLNNQSSTVKSEDYRRRQSVLYNKLNPMPDVELNLGELEDPLQQINGYLMSEEEFSFINHILKLPGRQKINFKLFSVIAALSEKIVQLEPVVKKLINKLDFDALDWKMEKSKEFFYLLDGKNLTAREGKIDAMTLAVELTAGGITPEHVNYAVRKFNRESAGTVEFLDFLTYVPLFIEIHDRICDDPLREKRTL